MKRLLLVLPALYLGLLFMMSCNDPSSIGADLLEEDQANVKYTDTITLRTSTVKEDSILVYDPNPNIEFNNFLMGDYDDPVFGNVKASIYAQLLFGLEPDFEGASVDSIVLSLKYDSLNVYGDVLTSPMGIGVYRLEENIPLNEEYFSNKTFDFNEMDPLFEDSGFRPQLSRSDSLIGIMTYSSSGDVDTINQAPHLRMHLPLEFANELLEYDSAAYSSFSNFLELFNGIHVKALTTTDGVVSFDLADNISGLTIYYEQDSLKKQFKFSFSSTAVRFSNFKHDHSGFVVENFLNTPTKGDSLVFLQSMGGPNVKVEIPYADKFDNLIVNKAELEFTYAILPEDEEGVYSPLSRMVVVRKESAEGAFLFISDVILGGQSFGGSVKERDIGGGNIVNQYSLNISSYFQQMVDGTGDNTIYLRAFPKQETGGRAVLFGPGHSVYPAKLILTYTKLNP